MLFCNLTHAGENLLSGFKRRFPLLRSGNPGYHSVAPGYSIPSFDSLGVSNLLLPWHQSEPPSSLWQNIPLQLATSIFFLFNLRSGGAHQLRTQSSWGMCVSSRVLTDLKQWNVWTRFLRQRCSHRSCLPQLLLQLRVSNSKFVSSPNLCVGTKVTLLFEYKVSPSAKGTSSFRAHISELQLLLYQVKNTIILSSKKKKTVKVLRSLENMWIQNDRKVRIWHFRSKGETLSVPSACCYRAQLMC